MHNEKYNKVLTVILIVLVSAILAIIGYLGYGMYQKHVNDKETAEVLETFDKLIVEMGNQENNNEPTNLTTSGGQYIGGININSLYYRGYKVIGKLEMPSVNLQYPILDMLKDAKAIDYSVAMQYGAGINKVGNTIIIGHNTNNGTFFGKNKKMNIGNRIYITDIEGNRIEYEIYNKYITAGSDYSYSNQNTEGHREVTLVTCDRNNKNRLILCAKEVK